MPEEISDGDASRFDPFRFAIRWTISGLSRNAIALASLPLFRAVFFRPRLLVRILIVFANPGSRPGCAADRGIQINGTEYRFSSRFFLALPCWKSLIFRPSFQRGNLARVELPNTDLCDRVPARRG